MGAAIISSLTQAVGRGDFIIARKVADAIRASGTSRVAMVCQLPWGPVDTVTPFTAHKTFRDMHAPDGFDRTSDGYLTATKFPWIDLQIVRVIGAGAVAASKNFQTSAPAACLLVSGLYKGAAGNSITVAIADATNAVANSFNMTVTITNSTTGLATTEFYENVDSTQAVGAAYWTTLGTGSKLVSFSKTNTGRPANCSATALASGTDGALAIASGDYIGTPGSADRGLALLENLQGDDAPAFVFCDDVGTSLLSAVNAGGKAHVALMADKRFFIAQGLPAETTATAKSNRSSLQSDHVAYVWGHAGGLDDAGTAANIPLAGALACIGSAMQPHLSPAFKNSDFTQLLSWITSVDVSTSSQSVKADLETYGIIAFEKNADGTFSPYCDVATDGSPIYVTRSRDYSAFTMTGALDQYRNGPNDDQTIQEERDIIEGLLARWLANRQIDHIARFSILGWELMPTDATNTQTDLDAGDCTLQYKMKCAAAQKRFFLVAEVGTTVTVKPATA